MSGPNKEQVYDEQIYPLMANIIEICKEHGISMLCHFAIPTPEDEDLRCTTCLPDEAGEFSDGVRDAHDAIFGSPPLMEIKTLDEDGNVLSSEVVIP